MKALLGSSLMLSWLEGKWEGDEYKEEFVAIGMSKSCELVQSCGTVEVASPEDGKWKRFRAGRFGWSVSCECLVSDAENPLEELMRDGAPVRIRLAVGGGGRAYEGDALISEMRMTGRLHDMATYRIGLTGCGELRRGRPTPDPSL